MNWAGWGTGVGRHWLFGRFDWTRFLSHVTCIFSILCSLLKIPLPRFHESVCAILLLLDVDELSVLSFTSWFPWLVQRQVPLVVVS
jgi:hypothetical protein